MFCDKNCTKQIQNSLSMLSPKNQLLYYGKLYNILKLHTNIFHSMLFPALLPNSFRIEVLKKMRCTNHIEENICFQRNWITYSKLSGRPSISCKGILHKKTAIKDLSDIIFRFGLSSIFISFWMGFSSFVSFEKNHTVHEVVSVRQTVGPTYTRF